MLVHTFLAGEGIIEEDDEQGFIEEQAYAPCKSRFFLYAIMQFVMKE